MAGAQGAEAASVMEEALAAMEVAAFDLCAPKSNRSWFDLHTPSLIRSCQPSRAAAASV